MTCTTLDILHSSLLSLSLLLPQPTHTHCSLAFVYTSTISTVKRIILRQLHQPVLPPGGRDPHHEDAAQRHWRQWVATGSGGAGGGERELGEWCRLRTVSWPRLWSYRL